MSIWRSVNYQCGGCRRVTSLRVIDNPPTGWLRVAGHEGNLEATLGGGARSHDEVFCSARCAALAVLRWWAPVRDIKAFENLFLGPPDDGPPDDEVTP